MSGGAWRSSVPPLFRLRVAARELGRAIVRWYQDRMDVRAGPPSQDPARTALLIIDMQNDFLAEGGAFSKRHSDPRQLAQTVAWLARARARRGGSLCG